MPTVELNGEKSALLAHDPDELRAQLGALKDEMQARLIEKRGIDWWPDLVFFVRDMQHLAGLLAKRGQDDAAEIIELTVTSTMERFAVRMFGDDDARLTEVAGWLREDGDEIDAVLEQQFGIVAAGHLPHDDSDAIKVNKEKSMQDYEDQRGRLYDTVEKYQAAYPGTTAAFRTELDKLEAEKGELWSELVGFMTTSRMFNATLDRQKAIQNAMFIGQFTMAIIKDKWPDTQREKMIELGADVEALTTHVTERLIEETPE